MKEELATLIERAYRTTGVRSCAGRSLGGLLGALILSTEDVARPFFKNYLLFDGSFFMLTDRSWRLAIKAVPMKARSFITRTSS